MKTVSEVTYSTHEDLQPCPFCGTKSDPLSDQGRIKMLKVELCRQVEKSRPYGITDMERTVYFAICRKCGATGGKAEAGYDPLTKNTTSEDQAAIRAVKRWNKRAEV